MNLIPCVYLDRALVASLQLILDSIRKIVWVSVSLIVTVAPLHGEIVEGSFIVSATDLIKSNTVDPWDIQCRVEVSGTFVVPSIDSEKFDILSYSVEWVPFVAGAAWDSDLGSNHVAMEMTGGFISGFGPKLAVNEVRSSSGAHSIGASSISHYSANEAEFPAGYFSPTDGTPKRFNFTLSASGTAIHYNTPDNHGSYAIAYWGSMKVSYRLLRLDPEAQAPNTLPLAEVKELEVRTAGSGPLGRPPSSVFDQIGFVPNSFSQIPSSTTFNGPKSFRTEVYGFSGYTYKLMVGETIGIGVAAQEIEGTNSVLSFEHTFGGSAPRGFAWIKEEKTP
jgi:hypothetical protein